MCLCQYSCIMQIFLQDKKEMSIGRAHRARPNQYGNVRMTHVIETQYKTGLTVVKPVSNWLDSDAMYVLKSFPFDSRLLCNLNCGIKLWDYSMEDFVCGYSLPWELWAWPACVLAATEVFLKIKRTLFQILLQCKGWFSTKLLSFDRFMGRCWILTQDRSISNSCNERWAKLYHMK